MNLQEIVKKVDDVRASIDAAFETGRLDFDRLSSDLATIGDALAEAVAGPAASATNPKNIKLEDYI